MRSDKFSEPFFNRAGIVEMKPGWTEDLRRIKSIFEVHHLRPYFFVQDTEEFSVLREALWRDYTVVDKMSVMEMRQPSFRSNPDVLVEKTTEEDARGWSEAYLESFYGDLGLMEPTLDVVRRSMRQEGVSFVSAKMEKSMVGTLAMFQREGVLGVYCVGTVPRFRRRGVANAMLEFAYDASRAAGATTMILQTMLSDGVEGLYIKTGLVSIYRKEVFELKEGSPSLLNCIESDPDQEWTLGSRSDGNQSIAPVR